MHRGVNSEQQNLHEITTKLRGLIENQSHELAHSKTAAKQRLMGKMKDLDESTLSENEKNEHRQRMADDLKAVEEESSNKDAVDRIAAR